jgi:hypothetical protein
MTLLQHPNIVAIKWEIRGRDQNWKRTLVVMTDLTLDPESESYDGQAEANFLDVVSEYWKRNPDKIDAVNIRSTHAEQRG